MDKLVSSFNDQHIITDTTHINDWHALKKEMEVYNALLTQARSSWLSLYAEDNVECKVFNEYRKGQEDDPIREIFAQSPNGRIQSTVLTVKIRTIKTKTSIIIMKKILCRSRKIVGEPS